MLAANVCAADLLKRHKHPGAVPRARRADRGKAGAAAHLPEAGRPAPGRRRQADGVRLRRADAEDQGAARCAAAADHAAALDAAGGLQPGQHRPLRPGVRSVCALHQPDPPLSGPADAPRDQGDPAGQALRAEGHRTGAAEHHAVARRRARSRRRTRRTARRSARASRSIWEALGVHCSANERRADEASRDVEAWLKCYFIRDKLGEEFTGIISGVTPSAFSCSSIPLFIEGLVHVTELGADYFQYDEARHELRGERTGMRYQLTDRVTVQVSRVDLDARKIDLRLVHEPGIKTVLKNEARRADAEHAQPQASRSRRPPRRTNRQRRRRRRPPRNPPRRRPSRRRAASGRGGLVEDRAPSAPGRRR